MPADEVQNNEGEGDGNASAKKKPFVPARKTLPNRGKLRVAVLRASGLAKADGLLGKCDPYMRVFWEEAEIFKSEHKRQTYSPKWDDAQIEIETEGTIAQILHTVAGNENRTEWTAQTGWRERPDGIGGVSYFNDASKKSGGAGGRLRIEMWDMDTGSDDEFLGQISYNGWRLAELCDGQEKEIQLGSKQGESDRFVKGKVVLQMSLEHDESSSVNIAPSIMGALGGMFEGGGAGGEASDDGPSAKSTAGAALAGATAGLLLVGGPVAAGVGAAGMAAASRLNTVQGERVRTIGNLAVKAVGAVGRQVSHAMRGNNCRKHGVLYKFEKQRKVMKKRYFFITPECELVWLVVKGEQAKKTPFGDDVKGQYSLAGATVDSLDDGVLFPGEKQESSAASTDSFFRLEIVIKDDSPKKFGLFGRKSSSNAITLQLATQTEEIRTLWLEALEAAISEADAQSDGGRHVLQHHGKTDADRS